MRAARFARFARLASPAAALALAVGLAAGCGGDDDIGSGEEEQSAQSAPSEDGATTEARSTSGGEPLGPADEGIDGVEAFEVTSADHTEEDVTYDHEPPVGGEHNPVPATCGFYDDTDPPPEEFLVHSIEHGAVWIAYGPDLGEDQLAALEQLAGDEAEVVVAPHDGLESPVVVTAWARQLALDSVDDPRLVQFIEQYRNDGGEAPEPDAACQGAGSPTVVSPTG